MENLDNNIYRKMENLKNSREATIKNTKVSDVVFIGSIDWIEKDSITNKDVLTKKDIFISIEQTENR